MQPAISRRQRKFIVKLILYFCILFSVYLFIYSDATDGNGSGSYRRNIPKVNIPPEIATILETTPYLWRNLDGNEDARIRIQAQQRWVKRLSKTTYLAENYNKKKIMWLEDDASYFYWTDGRVQCPYASDFEDKCELRQLSHARRLLGSYRFAGINGDAIISVRNWESKFIFTPPSEMLQILHIIEPPSIAKGTNLGGNNALLASYQGGSDIPTPYLVFIPYSSNNSSRNSSKELEKVVEKVRSKRKMVAAIISNCDGTDRLDYIGELQKYVQVDVFGKCGNFTCPKSQNHECLLKIEAEYKFFLAFENSRCEEYITEKLFDNALKYIIVPVVRGARPSDYLTSAPTNSYIHVDEFESPQKLGEYLQFLNQNENAYLRYLDWKGSGYISDEHFQDFFCRSCAMLYYADFIPPPTWERESIGWNDVNRCLSPNVTRWDEKIL